MWLVTLKASAKSNGAAEFYSRYTLQAFWLTPLILNKAIFPNYDIFLTKCCIAIIITLIYELQWMNEHTSFKKNISLTLYSRKGWCFCNSWEMEGETYTQKEDFFSPYLLLGARGCQRLAPPCKLVRDNLLTWFSSRGLAVTQPVRPECPDHVLLFTDHHVTACQSTRGH